MLWRVYAPPTGACYDGASRGGMLQQRPQQGHPATVPSERASYNSAFSRRLLITVPSERASCNSAPLQGGILKPPALPVVVDSLLWGGSCSIGSFSARLHEGHGPSNRRRGCLKSAATHGGVAPALLRPCFGPFSSGGLLRYKDLRLHRPGRRLHPQHGRRRQMPGRCARPRRMAPYTRHTWPLWIRVGREVL